MSSATSTGPLPVVPPGPAPGATVPRPKSDHLWLRDEDGDWYPPGKCWCYRGAPGNGL